jgi:hypothetical protein
MFTQRSLFGGAISCEIPSAWRDVSDIREVPDHQEVWHEPEDGSLLVVEILQQQEVQDQNVASFFFQDLAENNGITHANDVMFRPMTLAVPTIQIEGASICSGIGFQKIAMGQDYNSFEQRARNQEIRWTCIELCVLRLPRVHTDLLVTITRPLPNPNLLPGVDSSLSWSEAFQRVISSFKIRNWGLFG